MPHHLQQHSMSSLLRSLERLILLRAGTTPILKKKAPRMDWANENISCGFPSIPESLRELLRELWFSYCSSRGMPFREWNFVFREWNFEFRELLRECPGTLPELREWPFHSESFFPEIGVVPRLLRFVIQCRRDRSAWFWSARP